MAVAFDDGTDLASSVTVAVVDPAATAPVALVRLQAPSQTLLSLEAASTGGGVAGVVWVSGSSVGLAIVDPRGTATQVFLPTSGLSPSSCMVSGGKENFALACTMIDPSATPQVPETYVFTIRTDGTNPYGPFLASPIDGLNSPCFSVAVDSSGHIWVVTRDPNPASATEGVLYAEAFDPDGSAVTPRAPLANVTSNSPQVAMAPLGADRVVIGFLESPLPSANLEVHIELIQLGSSEPDAALTLPSPPADPARLAVFPNGNDGGNSILVEWLEQKDEAPVAGVPPMRLLNAVVDANLTLLDQISEDSRAFLPPATLAPGTGDVVTASGPFQLYRWYFAAPPQEATPGGNEAPVTVIVIAGVLGGVVGLALVEERARWGLTALFLPLFVRVRREKLMLDSMRRGAILQVINEEPGIRFLHLARRTAISRGALEHHLKILEFHGFVSKQSVNHQLRFFPEGKNPIAEEPFRELRERILRQIRERPGISHTQLAKALGLRWATLLYHLDLLHEEGRVRYRTRRQRRRYWVPETPLP